MKSLVSILINNYNYGRFVADAIDSALGQSYSNCEVIVVDDGSQDNSREVISRFGSRVKTVFKSNGGQSSAFNAGFAESSGDVICFLDSDDVFLPNKVEQAVEGLAVCPEGWCFHHIQWSDTALKPIFTPPIPYSTGKYDFRAALLEGKCRFAPPATSGLTFARDLLNQVMPIPEAITITSDNYLKLSSLALEPGYFIAEQYALQRIHGENAYTGRKDETMRSKRRPDNSLGPAGESAGYAVDLQSLVCGRYREEVGGWSKHRQHIQGLAGISDRYVLRRKDGDCGQDRLQGGSAQCLRARESAASDSALCALVTGVHGCGDPPENSFTSLDSQDTNDRFQGEDIS